MVYRRTACTMCVRNVTEEKTAVSLHDSQHARAGSTRGEKSFVLRDGWVSPTPQSNPNLPTSNGCSATPLHLQGADLSSGDGCPVIRATPILTTTSLDTVGLRSHLQNAFLSLRLSIQMQPHYQLINFLAAETEGPAPLTPAAGQDQQARPSLKICLLSCYLSLSSLFHFCFHSSFPQDYSLKFLINFSLSSS